MKAADTLIAHLHDMQPDNVAAPSIIHVYYMGLTFFIITWLSVRLMVNLQAANAMTMLVVSVSTPTQSGLPLTLVLENPEISDAPVATPEASSEDLETAGVTIMLPVASPSYSTQLEPRPTSVLEDLEAAHATTETPPEAPLPLSTHSESSLTAILDDPIASDATTTLKALLEDSGTADVAITTPVAPPLFFFSSRTPLTPTLEDPETTDATTMLGTSPEDPGTAYAPPKLPDVFLFAEVLPPLALEDSGTTDVTTQTMPETPYAFSPLVEPELKQPAEVLQNPGAARLRYR